MIGVSIWATMFQRVGGGVAPALTNDNSTITATGGEPAAPRLTNDNSTITAEAA